MGIIKFNILNLEKRSDRKNVLIGNFQTQGIDFEDVHFHKAPDGRDYKTSEDMCKAFVEQGYPIFEDLQDYQRGDLGYLLGTLKILEGIKEGTHPYGYYNQDDKLLVLSYPQLESICHTLQNSFEPDFLFLQMSWYAPPHCEITREKVPIFPSSKIMHGALGTGDSGILMSKAGADYLISEWNKKPQIFEAMIGNMWSIPGIYSIEKTEYAIQSADTRYFGHLEWVDDQDRITINQEKPNAE